MNIFYYIVVTQGSHCVQWLSFFFLFYMYTRITLKCLEIRMAEDRRESYAPIKVKMILEVLDL